MLARRNAWNTEHVANLLSMAGKIPSGVMLLDMMPHVTISTKVPMTVDPLVITVYTPIKLYLGNLVRWVLANGSIL